MRNLKLEIEYDGTNYCGWQVQDSPRKKSIQEVIEKILSSILQEKIRLVVSGRTDAGVHAAAQVANFTTKSGIATEKLLGALNGCLPADITIAAVEEEKPGFHSRYGAKSKVYRYTILNRRHPSALLRNTVYFYPHPLDLRLIRQEAKSLLGRHDFKSFQGSDAKKEDTVRTIKAVKVSKKADLVTIDIEGDGFLYNMVRSIAGTLIDIGRGKLAAGSIKKILLLRDRRAAGPTAPAKGLCLVRVKY